jgi:hypothetical protein
MGPGDGVVGGLRVSVGSYFGFVGAAFWLTLADAGAGLLILGDPLLRLFWVLGLVYKVV